MRGSKPITGAKLSSSGETMGSSRERRGRRARDEAEALRSAAGMRLWHAPVSAHRRSLDQLGVPSSRRLGSPLSRREVDIDEPEAIRVARAPFEIVEQRPDEIAAYVRTFPECRPHRADVGFEIGDAVAIDDFAALVGLVLAAAAVLGDIDRQAIT